MYWLFATWITLTPRTLDSAGISTQDRDGTPRSSTAIIMRANRDTVTLFQTPSSLGREAISDAARLRMVGSRHLAIMAYITGTAPVCM